MVVVAAAVALLAAAMGGAQERPGRLAPPETPEARMEAPLPAGAPPATLDARIDVGEYTTRYDFPRLDLHLSRSDSHLHAAVRAHTAGWVAVGVGSYLMDGARIMFGYVDAGTPVFVEQVGVDHEHIDTDDPLQAEAALSEQRDPRGRAQTLLEVPIPWSAVAPLVRNASRLPLIVAYGTDDSVTQIHRFNRSVVALLRSGDRAR